MKKLILIAALPLLFSACKQPEPPASVTETPSVESASQPGVRADLPKGIVLNVPYTLVSDEWIEEEGARKRKTVIEFEQSDAGAIGQQVTDSMVAARYRLTGSSETRGGTRFNFRGDPGLRVSILVRPRGAVGLQNSKSTGNIEVAYTEPSGTEAEVGQDSN
ncbi:hypothetical protein [Luteimonas terricola]|uniref:Lipoprotein n=1 Tax=Luteimonas terricola TaxID=645597 RepID=A0ABQ2EJ80_9GAMM|nr:hypothetical protein [Luteimonas terricola]GGK13398.1 hypothetical protein GCM10011394_23310 [Luteimonas terricola]